MTLREEIEGLPIFATFLHTVIAQLKREWHAGCPLPWGMIRAPYTGELIYDPAGYDEQTGNV